MDKTFDRFEIFTLRNILTVPDDLGGWMRLTHYEVSEGLVILIGFLCRASGEGAARWGEGGNRSKHFWKMAISNLTKVHTIADSLGALFI